MENTSSDLMESTSEKVHHKCGNRKSPNKPEPMMERLLEVQGRV